MRKATFGLAAMVVPVVIGSVAATGCGEDGLTPPSLCCDGFEVGADLGEADFGVDAEFEAEFRAFAQAMADLSATASATLGEVEIACLNIAKDMGATDAQIQTEQDKTGEAKVRGLCTLAAGRVDALFGASGEFSAMGSLTIDFQPPTCEASVSAQADCQAGCTVDGECDIQANPPTCEGGTLEVSCEGSCTAEAGASVSCEGSCTGNCSGSCKADVGATVECEGQCNGTCSADAMGNGNGVQADGSCMGFCDGTCEISADAEIQCEGSCQGSCDASCEAEAGASVKCDGECDGNFEPLKCKGGELMGGCEVEANCEANCSASASAKAECHPPSVEVVFELSGGGSLEVDAQARLNAAIASIETNLPNLLVAVQARGEAFVGNLTATVEVGTNFFLDAGDGLGVEGAICAVKVASAGATAVANMSAAVEASISVTGSLGVGG